MRLTDSRNTRSVVDERQRKVSVLAGVYARLTVGWVGLARLRKFNTADWLVDHLAGTDAANSPLSEIASSLREKAAQRFRFLSTHNEDKRCTFVFAGWGRRKDDWVPVLLTVSNFENAQGSASATARSDFNHNLHVLSNKRSRAIHLSGVVEVGPELRPYFRRVKKLLKRRSPKEPIITACIGMFREASRLYETVGPNAIVVAMQREDPSTAYCLYYPEDRTSPQRFAPDFVTSGLAFKRIESWQGDGPPPWWKS